MFKKLNIMRLFLDEPSREFNVRETARLLNISPATASKELRYLVKTGFLKERKERMLKLYKANIENEFYKDIKIFYNIRKLKESGFVYELNKFYLKPTIVLFGSAALGTDTETSDFDLLVISEKTKEFRDIGKFEKKLNRKVQIFTATHIKEIKNIHLINSILNGVVIQGILKRR